VSERVATQPETRVDMRFTQAISRSKIQPCYWRFIPQAKGPVTGALVCKVVAVRNIRREERVPINLKRYALDEGVLGGMSAVRRADDHAFRMWPVCGPDSMSIDG
jgi:hypothetical protein